MKLKYFLPLIFLPFMAMSQANYCDSLMIDCCTYNTITNNDVSIEFSNYSSNIFTYPGFILFDLNNDSIAIETVNYYDIGVYPQSHTMEFIAPFSLPFEGYLELHTNFYNFFACSFPISIPDTNLTTTTKNSESKFQVYPNPA